MKKLIAILVVFAVITGAAFAQTAGGVFVNAWGQGAFAPLMIQSAPLKDGEKMIDSTNGQKIGARTFIGVGPEWGWNDKISAQFNVGGSSEQIGWSVNVPVHTDITGNIWAKPFNGSDALKITIGSYTDDTLRGSGLGGRNGDALLPSFGMGRDDIFSRLGTDSDGCKTRYANVGGNVKTGFLITSVPVDGLFLGWNVNSSHTLNFAGRDDFSGNNRRANDAFRHSQAAIGYSISGIGQVRAMYLGGWAGKIDLENEKTMKKYNRADVRPSNVNGSLANDYDQASIQVAFRLTAIEGIEIDLGYRAFLPVTIWRDVPGDNTNDSVKYRRSSHGHSVAGNISMNFDVFNLGIFAGAKFGGYTSRNVYANSLDTISNPYSKDKKRNGLDLSVRIDPSLNLDFGTIGFMLAYHMQGSDIEWNSIDGKFNGKTGIDNKYKGYSHQIGMGLWYERSLGSGNFTVALTYTMPELNYDAVSEKAKFNGSHWIIVPITLTYSFF